MRFTTVPGSRPPSARPSARVCTSSGWQRLAGCWRKTCQEGPIIMRDGVPPPQLFPAPRSSERAAITQQLHISRETVRLWTRGKPAPPRSSHDPANKEPNLRREQEFLHFRGPSSVPGDICQDVDVGRMPLSSAPPLAAGIWDRPGRRGSSHLSTTRRSHRETVSLLLGSRFVACSRTAVSASHLASSSFIFRSLCSLFLSPFSSL